MNENAKISNEQGQALVRLARQTIAEHLGLKNKQETDDSAILSDKALQVKRGTFVTLHIGENLRGCIGTLTAIDSIFESIKKNAINAAFNDPRFRPLSADEFDKIDIEISVLTNPALLYYTDANDLISKLRPNIDGVLIKKGFCSATFLPQVWEQLIRPELFLSHLCDKAGLPYKAWESGKLEVLTYQVQYFEEK